MAKKTTISAPKTEIKQDDTLKYIRMPFGKINFYMMAGCIVLIILGFALMSGGGSEDGVSFNPEIFSTRRLVVGPLLTFLGFLLMAFAIIWKPRGIKKKDLS